MERLADDGRRLVRGRLLPRHERVRAARRGAQHRRRRQERRARPRRHPRRSPPPFTPSPSPLSTPLSSSSSSPPRPRTRSRAPLWQQRPPPPFPPTPAGLRAAAAAAPRPPACSFFFFGGGLGLVGGPWMGPHWLNVESGRRGRAQQSSARSRPSQQPRPRPGIDRARPQHPRRPALSAAPPRRGVSSRPGGLRV